MPLKTYKVEYEWKIGGGGVDEVKADSAEEAREEFIAEAPYRVKRIRVTEVKTTAKHEAKTDTSEKVYVVRGVGKNVSSGSAKGTVGTYVGSEDQARSVARKMKQMGYTNITIKKKSMAQAEKAQEFKTRKNAARNRVMKKAGK